MAKSKKGAHPKSRGKLNATQQTFVVRCLAEGMTPQLAADAVKEHYGIEITKQAAEGYHPYRHAGRKSADRWKPVFDKFYDDNEKAIRAIPIASAAFRIQAMQDIYDIHAGRKNPVAMMAVLIEMEKIQGGAYTNKRVIAGTGDPGQAITQRTLNDFYAGNTGQS